MCDCYPNGEGLYDDCFYLNEYGYCEILDGYPDEIDCENCDYFT